MHFFSDQSEKEWSNERFIHAVLGKDNDKIYSFLAGL